MEWSRSPEGDRNPLTWNLRKALAGRLSDHAGLDVKLVGWSQSVTFLKQELQGLVWERWASGKLNSIRHEHSLPGQAST